MYQAQINHINSRKTKVMIKSNRFFFVIAVFFLLVQTTLQSQTYFYDSGGRLTGATYANGTQVKYAYDTTGNILGVSTNTVVLDTNSLLLVITSPAQNVKLPNVATGTAGTTAGNVQVAGVYYQLNNAGWTAATTANNWNNWSGQVTLPISTNTLSAYAMDTSGAVSLTNNITVVATNLPTFKLSFAVAYPLTAGGLSFSLSVVSNVTGHIQVSTNLLNWTTLTNFSGSNTLNLFDPTATNFNRRFYRAVIP
jgi:YD repeat-containing protein